MMPRTAKLTGLLSFLRRQGWETILQNWEANVGPQCAGRLRQSRRSQEFFRGRTAAGYTRLDC